MKIELPQTNIRSYTDTNLMEVFCIFDEFCKYFAPELKKHTLQVPGKRHRNRSSRMSDSEIMTILILFDTCHFRNLKSFYLIYMSAYTQRLPAYDFLQPLREASGTNRITSVVISPDVCIGKVYGDIVSTPSAACHIKRKK